MPRKPWTPLALVGLLLLAAACAEIRANERPPVNPNWTPASQGGNRP
ncbi:MAG: hypothetical protein K2X74_05295 [Acetobacteraceae bacterium]|nr:hypothetical protein [Acetobacteraceae bacterium]